MVNDIDKEITRLASKNDPANAQLIDWLNELQYLRAQCTQGRFLRNYIKEKCNEIHEKGKTLTEYYDHLDSRDRSENLAIELCILEEKYQELKLIRDIFEF